MADTLKVNKEKKIEIIQYCIDHDHDYKGTAEFYGGNYAQIYNWVKKYESKGEDALEDKRGKRKAKEHSTHESSFTRAGRTTLQPHGREHVGHDSWQERTSAGRCGTRNQGTSQGKGIRVYRSRPAEFLPRRIGRIPQGDAGTWMGYWPG